MRRGHREWCLRPGAPPPPCAPWVPRRGYWFSAETGFDLKASDNVYHIKMRTGKAAGSVTNKYSEACLDLLRAVRDKRPYKVQKQEVKIEKTQKG
jgi:hypothetical protein